MKNIELPQEDFNFLKDLQNELLTQPDDGQADPRYWGILETKEEPSPNGIGTPVIYMGDGCTMDLEEAQEYAKETMLGDREFDIETEKYPDDWEELDKTSMSAFVDFCHEHFGWNDVRIVYLDRQQRVAEDAMFLTKRSCQKHIENNRHHYSRPQTYAMTAWRNPEMERLLNILKTIKFKEE